MPAPNVSVEVSEANELAEARGDEELRRRPRGAPRSGAGLSLIGKTRRDGSATARLADAEYLRDDDREVGLPIYRSIRPAVELHLPFLRSQIRGSLGTAGDGQSLRPYGRAATGAVSAGVHERLHQRALRAFPYG